VEEVALLLLVTVTWTVPDACAGAQAVIDVSELMTKAALTVPNWTLAVPRKPVPVMLTRVPPAVLPDVVARLLTVGVAAAV
jgi:hypothetical protein